MDEWMESVCAELGIGDDVDVDLLLNVARVVAHNVERRAAPIATYLLGVAAGEDPVALQAAADKMMRSARTRSPDST